jgi:hypothetical protein
MALLRISLAALFVKVRVSVFAVSMPTSPIR